MVGNEIVLIIIAYFGAKILKQYYENVFHKQKKKREAIGKNFRAQPSDGGQPGP